MQLQRGWAMLPLSLLVVGACTSFGNESNPTSAENGPAVAAPDGGSPVVTGAPSHGIALTVGPPNTTAFVLQGGTLDLPLTVVREASSQAPVTVTVSGLPPKVIADPLVIPAGALTGTLKLRADAASIQGASTVEVVALESGALGAGTSVKLKAFVRGAPGAVDTTFGSQGMVRHIFGSAKAAVAKDLLMFDDGHIGAVAQCGFYGCVARTSADGVIDTSYGTAGIGAVVVQGFGTFGQAGVDAMGRVYLSGNGGAYSILIGRLTAAGQTDLSYNASGAVPSIVQYGSGPPEGQRTVLAVRKDGTAVVAFAYDPAGPTARVGVRVVDPKGITVPSFGTGGLSVGDVMQLSTVPVVGVRTNGNIWAAYLLAPSAAYCRFQVIDGTAGTADPGFGINGGLLPQSISPQDNPTGALDLGLGGAAELPDGTLVAAVRGESHAVIGKLLANGSGRDPTWGSGGIVTIAEDAYPAVSVGKDGLVLVTLARADGLRLVRLMATGSPDATFGDKGTVVHAFGTNQKIVRALVQKDGRIVVIASEDFDGVSDVSLTRYWN